MIKTEQITGVMEILSKACKIEYSRANQTNAPKLKKPYLSYNIMQMNEAADHLDFLQKKIVNEKVIKNIARLSSAVVSLSVISLDAPTGWKVARDLFLFLNTHPDRLKIENETGLYVTIISEQIQDRSSYLDVEYEFQHGFDILLEQYSSYKNEIDFIEKIKIEGKSEIKTAG